MTDEVVMTDKKDRAVQLNCSDVRITDLAPPDCHECGDQNLATKEVWIDFRSAGMAQCIGQYCAECAETLVERIRNGLPEDSGS